MSSFATKNGSCALCLFSLTVLAIVLQKQRAVNKRRKSLSEKSRIPNSYENEYFPPLPDEVVEVLRTSKLCYLATQSDGNPHLSLMNFTYCRKEEVIILSTRRNTKKFYQIVENPKVAVLIHDFPVDASPRGSIIAPEPELRNAKQWSITLNGVAEAMEDVDEMTKYFRGLHLENNPNYGQFIVGGDIAVLVIHIDKARMCDVQDRVSYWNARDGVTGTEM